MERAIPNLPADDLRTAKAFYVGQLGFNVVYEATEDGTSGVLGLQRGGFALHLDAPMSGHGRNVVVTLEVDDADDLFNQWRGATAIEGVPRDEDWGGRTFGVTDPFGNLLFVVGPAGRAAREQSEDRTPGARE
jgi:catechol 2,3-dioxygenase-like lactoylglutathione lyase family enzyme